MRDRKHHGTPWGPILIAAMVVLLVSAMFVPMEVPRPSSDSENRSAATVPAPNAGECAGYDESAADVSAMLDSELEWHDFNSGNFMQTGQASYNLEREKIAEAMKLRVEKARRCGGYSDADLGLTSEIRQIIGVGPKSKRGRP